MSLPYRSGALAVPLAAAALLVAGCGGTQIDPTKMQDELKENVEQVLRTKVSSVECPSGVEVKVGSTFKCTVQLQGGKTETATLRIRNSDADTEVTDFKPAK